MTVIQYESPPPLPPSRPGDELDTGPAGDVARLRAAAEYAGFIADTEFVPEAMRGRPASIAAAMLAGAEVGLKPMASLRMVAMIKGRPTLTAEAQRGLVTAAGHELWFEESTVTRAIAAGRRAGSERVGRVTWTLDDAKRAGIGGQHNWRSYPAEMLRARASAALARAMFADVTLGIPATEEIDEGPDNGAPPSVADATSLEPSPSRRRRRTAAPAETTRPPVTPTPPADQQPEPDATPDVANDAQLKRMFALFHQRRIEDRAERLAYSEQILGHKISSSKELTAIDASRLIEALETELANEQTILDELKDAFDATPDPPLPGEDALDGL